MIEAENKHNPALLDEFIAPDFVDEPDTPKETRGLEGLKQLMNMGFKVFLDWHETIEDIIAEGDKVWIRFKGTGTHKGEFLGLAPTGKKITAKDVDIYRIVNGKLAKYWSVTDNVDILKQIGAIEYTEKGKKAFPEDVK